MVILGLGSNLGDRLVHLRLALTCLSQLPQLSIQQISPIYISDALLPENAPVTWDTPYLNLAVRCETQLSPYELLHHLKAIERKVGRTPEKTWGPRIIDIDLLAWDDLIQYDEKLHIPHEGLSNRPFALWPLADVAPFWVCPIHGKTAAERVAAWGSRFTGEAPFHTRQIAQRLETPQLVGILNITPDSFSDGGKFTSPAAYVAAASALVAAGAEIIDLGAEATNPAATTISATTEWQRLEPVLNAILAASPNLLIPPKISIDTRHASVANKALALGVDWINDVSGLQDVAMREIVKAQACDIVVMHNLGIPANENITLPWHENAVTCVLQWAEQRLTEITQYGIAPERLIFDVGIGFGKTTEQSLVLLQHCASLHKLGTRLLIGHSRKRFLSQFTVEPYAERDLATTVLSLFLAQQQIHYLRVHNVAMHTQAFKIASHFITSDNPFK